MVVRVVEGIEASFGAVRLGAAFLDVVEVGWGRRYLEKGRVHAF